VDGPYPVYASRGETNEVSEGCSSSHVSLDTEERLQLIAEMLNVGPEAIPWRASSSTQIEFASPEQFDRMVLTFIEAQQTLYRTTVAALAARNLMSPLEAQQSLPQLLLIIDHPRGRSTPFPAPPNLPSQVKWVPLL
jgi:hypothetical protein